MGGFGGGGECFYLLSVIVFFFAAFVEASTLKYRCNVRILKYFVPAYFAHLNPPSLTLSAIFPTKSNRNSACRVTRKNPWAWKSPPCVIVMLLVCATCRWDLLSSWSRRSSLVRSGFVLIILFLFYFFLYFLFLCNGSLLKSINSE